MASKENLLTGVRLLAFLIYGYSIYYQQVNPNPFNVHAIGKMKFLTYWDLLLQFSFFTLILITQSLLKIKSKSLTKSINVIFYSLTLPVSLIVAVTFWGLYAIDREIIFPKAIEKYYPVWLNHATHTLVAVLPFAELWFGKYKMPSKRLSLVILNAFMVLYLVVMLYLALVDNLWVYPFLNLLNWPQRIAFFAGCFVANCGFYYVGVLVTDMKNDSASRHHHSVARNGKSKNK